MNEWSFFCGNGGNQSWQVWVSLRGNTKMAEFKMAKFKMAEFKMAVIIKLEENEWVWVRVRVEWECFWVNLREDNQGVWIQDGSVWNQHDSIQDGCHHQVESEWMSEICFVKMVENNLGKCELVWEEILRWLNSRWTNSRWQNSRWLSSSS